MEQAKLLAFIERVSHVNHIHRIEDKCTTVCFLASEAQEIMREYREELKALIKKYKV